MPVAWDGSRCTERATAEENAVTHGPPVPVRADEAGRLLADAGLSDWFDPFLTSFAREALRLGGRAVVEMERSRPVGLLVTDPVERTASVFSRSSAVAGRLARESGGFPVYSEVELEGTAETFRVYTVSLSEEPRHRFRHPVRLLAPEVVPRIAPLIREVYGTVAEPWLGVAADEGERCLGVEVDGRPVGIAWVFVVAATARLHGLTVRAEYRRLGIGTDLVLARLAYAFRHGARQAISEIADRNLASRATAERAGMRPRGRLFLVAPPSFPPLAEPAGAAAGPSSTSA